MDQDLTPASEEITLTVPCGEDYLPVVRQTTASAARLAGLGPHAAGRAGLLVNTVFQHLLSQAGRLGRAGACRITWRSLADGLRMCFTTEHLALDPHQIDPPTLEEVLCDEACGHPEMYLVGTYAQDITLTARGGDRTLCLTLPRREDQEHARPWSRLVPSLRQGVTLTPMQHQGKLVRRVDGAADGKSYLAHPLAQHVLELIDGRRTLASIMAGVLKVMPEASPHTVEDLFEMLIKHGLITTSQEPSQPTEVSVRQDPSTRRALEAYREAGKK